MFKERIKELRKNFGYTQKEIANKLNISHQAYSKYENGVTEPSIETINNMAIIFNTSTDYLLGSSNDIEDSYLEKGISKISVLGSVPAGIPLEAIEDIVDYEYIPTELLRNNEYFALKISGDSMSPQYLNNDTVIFKKQSTVDSGQNAVVYVNGYDATFKKVIKKDNGSIVLQPLNNNYEPIIVNKDESFTVLGIPYETRRKI